jgi:hypothetical protein
MAGANQSAAIAWKPSYNPWLIAMAVMVPTFMEVIDTSIASVALPYIAGSVSATPGGNVGAHQLPGGQRHLSPLQYMVFAKIRP